MDSDSDSDDLMDQSEEFRIHPGNMKHSSSKSVLDELGSKCEQIRDKLLKQQIDQTVNKMLETMKHNIGPKSLIFPIHFSINQETDLPLFIQRLTTEVERRSQDNRQRHIIIRGISQTQTKDIALKIYIILEEAELQVNVFLCVKITDLNCNNIYCFEKGLKRRRFYLIIPTFEVLQKEHETYTQSIGYQKIHFELYNSKELFCHFMYECVSNPEIKAYLPKQILSLISDMDYYPISYKQATRRFIFCLQSWRKLVPEPSSFVSLAPVIEKIEKAISNVFCRIDRHRNYQKILKCILDQNVVYTIPDKLIDTILNIDKPISNKLEEEDILEEIREKLYQLLQNDVATKHYCVYLVERSTNNKVQQKGKKTYKKSRLEKLGFTPGEKHQTQKTILEDQITALIRQTTREIRKEGKKASWQAINYSLRIKPEIPRLIHEGCMQSQEHVELMNQISNYISMPVSKLLRKMGGKEGKEAGKLMYLLRDLEIAGMVELSKKTIKPMVSINYFEKAYMYKK